MLGIDEVGRGPLAGPVTVCLFFASKNTDLLSLFDNRKLKDSKKLTKKKREEIYNSLLKMKKAGFVNWKIINSSADKIDRIGISKCIYNSIKNNINKFKVEKTNVLLDGALAKEFGTVIIKGDEKVDVIACASIVAKVCRDRYMTRLHKTLPVYGFADNSGYGTEEHRKAIIKFGPSKYHRLTYLKNILK